jgi:hypothetical protein
LQLLAPIFVEHSVHSFDDISGLAGVEVGAGVGVDVGVELEFGEVIFQE